MYLIKIINIWNQYSYDIKLSTCKNYCQIQTGGPPRDMTCIIPTSTLRELSSSAISVLIIIVFGT